MSKDYRGMKTYITTVDKTFSNHRSPVIIHRGWQFYIEEFNSIEQLNRYAEMLGFTYEFMSSDAICRDGKNVIYTQYGMSHEIVETSLPFWKLSDLPKDAKPFIDKSNGKIVTCYFTNDGETITIYRPNPNAKEVYTPVSREERVKYYELRYDMSKINPKVFDIE